MTAVRPCALNPPMTEMACGVSPTWPITATPPLTILRTVAARSAPPSIFTASMPHSFTNRYAFVSACSSLTCGGGRLEGGVAEEPPS